MVNATGRYRRWMVATIAALGFVLALGCGFGGSDGADDAPPPAAASLPDPCQLLTTAEVAEVQGGVILPGSESQVRGPGDRLCSFGREDNGGTTTITVAHTDPADFAGERDVVNANFPVEDIADLGDGAFIGAAVLHVRKDKLMLTVFTGGDPDPNVAKEKEIRLARKILPRL